MRGMQKCSNVVFNCNRNKQQQLRPTSGRVQENDASSATPQHSTLYDMRVQPSTCKRCQLQLQLASVRDGYSDGVTRGAAKFQVGECGLKRVGDEGSRCLVNT